MSLQLTTGSTPPSKAGCRADIYYWKCDRPATLHGVRRNQQTLADGLPQVQHAVSQLLSTHFGKNIRLLPGPGKGNHLTFVMEAGDARYFVRVEDGPEGDGHLQIESAVIDAVSRTGVPVPKVFFTDASRRHIPFAVQVIELYHCSDMNRVLSDDGVSPACFAAAIGEAVAKWQRVPTQGFGTLRGIKAGVLCGYHKHYADYFNLRLEQHLQLLGQKAFLSACELERIREVCAAHHQLLALADEEGGVLVHKDLAFWNMLGTRAGIEAFIDWDDAIVGDPMDDLSLLGSFHSGAVVAKALEGYQRHRPLPEGHVQRFWLHLLRNMIVKAVIRYGAGYFDHAIPLSPAQGRANDSIGAHAESNNGAYMLSPQQGGTSLYTFTRERLLAALDGLTDITPIDQL